MRHRFVAALTAAASFVMLLTSVHISLADVIDGDWCRADGKRMKIRGPEIVTPGGNQTRGDYTRHSFSYVVPAGEAGAGENVSIILLSEYLAHARQGSDTAPIRGRQVSSVHGNRHVRGGDKQIERLTARPSA